jgi:uncharacterized membrane protein YfcA
MGYGIISATILLASGVIPSQVSAAVHAAKLPTTCISGISHIAHRNVIWPLFLMLAICGSIGGAFGAYLLTSIPSKSIRPYIVAYLGIMGLIILWRAIRGRPKHRISGRFACPLGCVGGFLDAIGGGGWGPVVTTSLIGRGGEPRFVIGSTNAAEFVVTVVVVSSFLTALLTGHWEEARGLEQQAVAIGGLILGGLPAAALAGYLLKRLPARPVTAAVGLLVSGIAIYQMFDMWRT